MKAKRTKAEDAQRRADAATQEFAALLDRHKVQWTIEQGENGLTGKFLRILFFVPLDQQAKKDPTTP